MLRRVSLLSASRFPIKRFWLTRRCFNTDSNASPENLLLKQVEAAFNAYQFKRAIVQFWEMLRQTAQRQSNISLISGDKMLEVQRIIRKRSPFDKSPKPSMFEGTDMQSLAQVMSESDNWLRFAELGQHIGMLEVAEQTATTLAQFVETAYTKMIENPPSNSELAKHISMDCADVLKTAGAILSHQGSHDAASKAFLRCLEVIDASKKRFPDTLFFKTIEGRVCADYSLMLEYLGKHEDAYIYHQRIFKVFESLDKHIDEMPQLPWDHPHVASSPYYILQLLPASAFNNAANEAIMQTDLDVEAATKVNAVKIKMENEEPPPPPKSVTQVPSKPPSMVQASALPPEYYEALLKEREENLGGRDHPALLPTLYEAALLTSRLSQSDKAEALLKRALAIAERISGQKSAPAATAHAAMGLVAVDKADFEGAAAHVKRALEMKRAVLGMSHLHVALLQALLGHIQVRRGNISSAMSLLVRASGVLAAEGVPPNHPWYMGLKQAQAAVAAAQKLNMVYLANELEQGKHGEDAPVRSLLEKMMAEHFGKQNETEEAEEAEEAEEGKEMEKAGKEATK